MPEPIPKTKPSRSSRAGGAFLGFLTGAITGAFVGVKETILAPWYLVTGVLAVASKSGGGAGSEFVGALIIGSIVVAIAATIALTLTPVGWAVLGAAAAAGGVTVGVTCAIEGAKNGLKAGATAFYANETNAAGEEKKRWWQHVFTIPSVIIEKQEFKKKAQPDSNAPPTPAIQPAHKSPIPLHQEKTVAGSSKLSRFWNAINPFSSLPDKKKSESPALATASTAAAAPAVLASPTAHSEAPQVPESITPQKAPHPFGSPPPSNQAYTKAQRTDQARMPEEPTPDNTMKPVANGTPLPPLKDDLITQLKSLPDNQFTYTLSTNWAVSSQRYIQADMTGNTPNNGNKESFKIFNDKITSSGNDETTFKAMIESFQKAYPGREMEIKTTDALKSSWEKACTAMGIVSPSITTPLSRPGTTPEPALAKPAPASRSLR